MDKENANMGNHEVPMTECDLSQEQVHRYARHLALPNVGAEAQSRLCKSKAVVVGAGGLGSSALLFLAAAGVGHITIIDGDEVERSNLQRQIAHTDARVGVPKAESAKQACQALNPQVHIDTVLTYLTAEDALEVVPHDADVLLDCSDNAATRYLCNDISVILDIPLVWAGAVRTDLQVSVFNFQGGPTYRCVWPDPPAKNSTQSCSSAGVLGVVPGIAGSVQALEAMKVLGGFGQCLSGRLLLLDALSMRTRTVRLRERQDAEVDKVRARGLIGEKDTDSFACGSGGDEATLEMSANLAKTVPSLLPTALLQRMQAQEELLLIDVRPPHEYAITSFRDAVSVPLPELTETKCAELARSAASQHAALIFICRRGRKSVKATRRFLDFVRDPDSEVQYDGEVYNMEGGMLRWHLRVDSAVLRY